MREILFRGQCCTDGKWVEGYLGIEVPDELVIQQFSFDEYFKSNCIDQYSVKPETVGQYTGLCDSNGRKIFEGDIVTVFYNPNYIGVSKDRVGNFIVVFHDACFMKRKITKPMSGDAGLYHFIQSDEFKVIGNIYDNPELLGGEKNG